MSFLRAILWILMISLGFVVLQGTVLPSLLPESLVPSLMVILVVFIAFYEPTSRGAVLAFLSGLVVDLSSGLLLGPWACGCIATFVIFAGFSQRLFVESYLAGFIAVVIGVVIANPVYLALYYGAGFAPTIAISHLLMQGVVTALIGPPVIRALSRTLCRRDVAVTGGMFQARKIKGGSR